MKKNILLISLFISCFMSTLVQAKNEFPQKAVTNIKTIFIPYLQKTIDGSVVYTQDENGGFICDGTTTMKEDRGFFNHHLPYYQCNGTQMDYGFFVMKKLNGKYLGSNFIYRDTNLTPGYSEGGLGIQTINSDLSGIIIYYTDLD